METINRFLLKKQIIKGLMEVKCDFHYTDDYAWDAATNFGTTNYRPATFFPSFWKWLEEKELDAERNDRLKAAKQADWDFVGREYSERYQTEKAQATKGTVSFDEGHFKGFGRAWQNEDGTITLNFSYKSYTLRLKQA